MSISDKLADLNWKRNQVWKTIASNARPAVYTFDGDVYIGLDAYSLPQKKKYKFCKIVCVFFRVCMDC
jgi:cytoplasmic iron level regulating protein YaaA (DUF328/UPF0246 family)